LDVELNEVEFNLSVTFIFFAITAILAIASGIITISSKNPVVSALSLIFHFFMLAGLYLTLQAQFIAVIQILVYAGAIMVLVVFVIMLLNLGKDNYREEIYSFRKAAAYLLGPALALMLLSVFLIKPSSANEIVKTINYNGIEYTAGSVELIAEVLYTDYLFPFEAIAILLIAAILGAVVLAKRNLH
jgi:NADH-quinone oxidoreductase subunit J